MQKQKYFDELNPRDKKKFWKSVKYPKRKQTFIPVLTHGDTVASTSSEKAAMLNKIFSDCFNLSQPPLTPEDLREFQPTSECAEALLCSEEEIHAC